MTATEILFSNIFEKLFSLLLLILFSLLLIPHACQTLQLVKWYYQERISPKFKEKIISGLEKRRRSKYFSLKERGLGYPRRGGWKMLQKIV